MSDWRALLRHHDPAAETIDADRADRMRRAVVEAARHSQRAVSPWPFRLAMAGVTVVLLTAGAGDIGRMSGDRLVTSPPASSGERRQVQFDTPGGTRIIWEINPDFTLTETMP
jgi:hypothetical protein